MDNLETKINPVNVPVPGDELRKKLRRYWYFCVFTILAGVVLYMLKYYVDVHLDTGSAMLLLYLSPLILALVFSLFAIPGILFFTGVYLLSELFIFMRKNGFNIKDGLQFVGLLIIILAIIFYYYFYNTPASLQ